jgi:CRISPR/Cas system CSM-associated protein Csm3 (group 7 of RAMP superfamily)
MRIDYEIRFTESWRIGSGEGAGPFVDSLVRRDGSELPFVPGTTVRGIAVEALRELCGALGLDHCDGTVQREDPEQPPGRLCGVTLPGVCPLCAVAGSPHREGEVRWGPARPRLTADGAEIEQPAARRAIGKVAGQTPGLLARSHPRTAIERRSGRAADEQLFNLEEASGGLVLAGRAEDGGALTRDQVALLLAALRWIREVGGGRRRGLGACRIHFTEVDLAPHFGSWQEGVRHLETLDRGAPAATAPPPHPEAPERAMPGPIRAEDGADRPQQERPSHGARSSGLAGTVLRLDAEVMGEVSLGRRPESGNQISGLSFVPGSALRGALAARWRGDPERDEFQRCFLSGSIRFGFLYPPAADGTVLPARLSVHTCKLRPGPRSELRHDFVDLLYWPDAERCREEGCNARLVPWQPPFDADLPALALSPHNRIDRASQTVGAAGLFAYEALAEGTTLRGFIRAEAPADLDLLLAGVGLEVGKPFELRAGRRKGSLGFLACTLAAVADDSGMGLVPEIAPLPDPWPGGRALRIDLVSPAIVRDERLRFRRHLLPADFGLARGGFDAQFAAGATIAGWHAAHGLPKADSIAVAAGSSCLLEEVTAEEVAILRQAVLAGIGERREEGFGAFAMAEVTAADRARR